MEQVLVENGYNSFPRIFKLPSGKFVLFYYSGVQHPGVNAFGVIKMRTSVDDGVTWSSPTTIFSESGIDIRGDAFGVTSTGRIIAVYARYDNTTSVFQNSYSRYSDDEGITWSSPLITSNMPFPHGNIITINDGKLLLPTYSNNQGHIFISEDNGETWNTPRISVIPSNPTLGYTEPSFIYLGNNVILGLIRHDNLGGNPYKRFRQVVSLDNGTNWIDQGFANFDNWQTAGPSWLTSYIDDEGQLIVRCFYQNRTEGKLKVIDGNAYNLFTHGPDNWDASTLIELSDIPVGLSGYPSFYTYGSTPSGIGVYYFENSITSSYVKIFTYSSIPITETVTPIHEHKNPNYNLRIEKKISNIVERHFPQFYQTDGQTFIQFVKAYYEWLEESGNVVEQSRNFFENRDIDDTLEDFLIFFQKKYLYGIPFNVIINKRYLLKHVLDVYRSKGSIQAYKLLFKLIYDQDIEVYLPSRDILRVSDGTWEEPIYIEVSNVDMNVDLVGKVVHGLASKTTAIVENYVREPINNNILACLYLSNISPRNGSFLIGEKIIDISDLNSPDLAAIVSRAPTVTGSLASIEILNGGLNFRIGDILKIAKNDVITGDVISYGVEGVVKVSEVARGRGRLNFEIVSPGDGYMANVQSWVFNDPTDTTGNNGRFEVENFYNVRTIGYNEDIIAEFDGLSIDATSYGFIGNTSANSSTSLEDSLRYTSNTFGSLLSLGSINVGNNYTKNPDVFVKTTMPTNDLTGNVTYTTASANIEGDGTSFTTWFLANSVIQLQANGAVSNVTTLETHIVRQVVNNTVLILYDEPSMNSTSDAVHRLCLPILESNFANNDPNYVLQDGEVSGFATVGNNYISNTVAINSGKGYVDGEIVKMYLFGAVENPTILNGGTGYSNSDILVFSGGNPLYDAQGGIQTNANGTITSALTTYYGAGYQSVPSVLIKTSTGTGASLSTSLVEFNELYETSGIVRKSGLGKERGRYTTTRGHLNSDKYVQDSFYYQDFSYEIQAETSLSKYKDILYETFHIAGTELFGKYLIQDSVSLNVDSINVDSIGITDDYPIKDRTHQNILDRNGNYIIKPLIEYEIFGLKNRVNYNILDRDGNFII